jgi:hypothetical protein
MMTDDHERLETFDQRIQTYLAEHPDCQEAELLAYGALLQAATPGLREAIRAEAIEARMLACMIHDDGHGWPFAGLSTRRGADGDRVILPIEEWSLDDWRLNWAWWQGRPGPRDPRLAGLIAYAEGRWAGVALLDGPWPDGIDLPPWGPILAAEARLEDE